MIDNGPSKLLVPADPAEQASGSSLAKVGCQKQIATVAKSKVKIVPNKVPETSDSGDSPAPSSTPRKLRRRRTVLVVFHSCCITPQKNGACCCRKNQREKNCIQEGSQQ